MQRKGDKSPVALTRRGQIKLHWSECPGPSKKWLLLLFIFISIEFTLYDFFLSHTKIKKRERGKKTVIIIIENVLNPVLFIARKFETKARALASSGN